MNVVPIALSHALSRKMKQVACHECGLKHTLDPPSSGRASIVGTDKVEARGPHCCCPCKLAMRYKVFREVPDIVAAISVDPPASSVVVES